MEHPQTAVLIGGLLYVALPVMAWTILYKRYDRTSVAMWCGGGLLFGLGFTLIGLKGVLPTALCLVVGNSAAFASYIFRGAALRRELGWRSRPAGAVLVWLTVSAAYWLAYATAAIDAPRLLVGLIAHLAGSVWLARLTWSLYGSKRFRSAGMITGAYGLFIAALAAWIISVLAHWSQARALSGGLEFTLVYIASAVAALYGTLGYIGIALEAARAEELARAAEFASEHERNVQTELRVQQQAALLEERGRLLGQREEMLAALAHEVRQPLNNASAALQSAAQAMAEGGRSREDASVRLQRANAVLAQVTAALDNTLADAVLLAADTPLARHDVDVDTLVAMAIADVEPMGQGRVRCERATGTRTASMHAGLMRLALRNLIANALAYSPTASPVVVRIADSDEPLALVVDVCDQGAGFPAELTARLFSRGARGDHVNNRQGHGLGLYIVRRVMEMHSGEVRVLPGADRGLTMRLVIPQDVAE